MLDRKLVEQHGGDASKDAKEKDKATAWLNENSAGTGAYRLARWERNRRSSSSRNDALLARQAGRSSASSSAT